MIKEKIYLTNFYANCMGNYWYMHFLMLTLEEVRLDTYHKTYFPWQFLLQLLPCKKSSKLLQHRGHHRSSTICWCGYLIGRRSDHRDAGRTNDCSDGRPSALLPGRRSSIAGPRSRIQIPFMAPWDFQGSRYRVEWATSKLSEQFALSGCSRGGLSSQRRGEHLQGSDM